MKNVILIFYLAQADILEQINKNVIQPVSKVNAYKNNGTAVKMTCNLGKFTRTNFEVRDGAPSAIKLFQS